MNTVKDGKICITEDCVSFATSQEELAEWAKRNNVHCSDSTDHRSYFASIETADYSGILVKVVMTIDQSGLQSFSLRRVDWLAIGNSIADYDTKALRAEYRNLGSLVEQATQRKPDRISNRELTWTEGIYDVTVSYEPMAFEVGIFFSRRKIN